MRKKVLSVAIAALMFLAAIVPFANTAFAAPIADKPTGVDGRILTPEQTGDVSEWVEIAQNGDYSLIVRANYINLSGFHYGEYTWQYTSFGATNVYKTSNLRDKINNWFNSFDPVFTGGKPNDVLPKDARLRNFTMQNNALSVPGTSCSPKNSLTDGLSKPTAIKASVGNDVAFALSYSEAANFVSKIYFMREMSIANQISSDIAISNYEKITIPIDYIYCMWLRSPGDLSYTAAAMSCEYGAYPGRVFQNALQPGNTYTYTLVYPALWVDSAIFKPDDAFIEVEHRDAKDNSLLDTESFVVVPGVYGPYEAKSFEWYFDGVLAEGSAPAKGTVKGGDEITITYLYERLIP
ncbi:MAG: hypothetical protein FWH28_05545 [Clostridiales bacterium]|nr:hypothetical protein [Clostridiales bacterium]